MFDREGKVIALGGIVTDISERKLLEESALGRTTSTSRCHSNGNRAAAAPGALQRVATQDPLTG
jgi:hypothetical protein